MSAVILPVGNVLTDRVACEGHGCDLCLGVTTSAGDTHAQPGGCEVSFWRYIAGPEGVVCSYPVLLRTLVRLGFKFLLCDLCQITHPAWIVSSAAFFWTLN